MPATNMAGPLVVPANPSGGKFVLMTPFGGPKGSPLDRDQAGNASTGALSTGMGFNATRRLNVSTGTAPATPPQSIKNAGFTDDYIPGVTLPNGTLATTAILLAIGGGRSNIVGGGNTGLGVSTVAPFIAVPILGFGAGGSRDAGAGPVFTGFGTKIVTAAGAVAIGAVVETGFVNRGESAMVATESILGSGTGASVTPTVFGEEEE